MLPKQTPPVQPKMTKLIKCQKQWQLKTSAIGKRQYNLHPRLLPVVL